MCTTAEPSMILASTFGTDSEVDAIDSKQLIKSDLFVLCMMPFDANDGDQGLFPCVKKESMSLSLTWHAVYILEKRLTSLFRLGFFEVDFS